LVFFGFPYSRFALTIRKGNILKLVLASIALALAAYSHYFAGLTGFLILLLDAKMLKTNFKEVLYDFCRIIVVVFTTFRGLSRSSRNWWINLAKHT
jgi:hypothetical protein